MNTSNESTEINDDSSVNTDKSSLISDRGFWLIDDASTPEHAFDLKLAKSINKFLKRQRCLTVLDLGCGLGDYCNYLEKKGIACTGYDGNPYTEQLTNGKYNVLDLSVDVDLGQKYDWILSLEVGEHIPMEYEFTFINNLVKHANSGIIISWAVEGQGGLGHVNCRNNDYIKERMHSHGFISSSRSEKFLRKNLDLYWFENTIMVFKKV